MKKEIADRSDIQLLVDEFYKKVLQDGLIGHFFTEVVQISWEKHMPVMYQFWESVLLGQATYRGNAMVPHIELNRKSPLRPEHFGRWQQLWGETLDEHFTGEKVDEAKRKAEQMALLMQFKIEKSAEDGFIL